MVGQGETIEEMTGDLIRLSPKSQTILTKSTFPKGKAEA